MSKAKDLLEIWNKERNNHDQFINTDEAVDVKKVIQTLIDAKPSDDNKDQGQFVQLLKGMAFSDDPASTKFMKKLMDLVSDSNFGAMAK